MRISREKAVQEGYSIDDTCYPPVAYKGERFTSSDLKQTFTPLEHELMGLAFISMQSLYIAYKNAATQVNHDNAKKAYDRYRDLIMMLTGEDPTHTP